MNRLLIFSIPLFLVVLPALPLLGAIPITPEIGTETITWIGLGCPEDYDKDGVDEKAKNEALRKGLQLTEAKAREGCSVCQEQLAFHHFYETKDYQKSLYWAFKAAKQGSGETMGLLFKSYGTGTGVVTDYNEALKWIILSAARGEEKARKVLDEYIRLFGEDSKWILRGREMANEWIKQNPKAFFSPD
jgi:hypothetical protein